MLSYLGYINSSWSKWDILVCIDLYRPILACAIYIDLPWFMPAYISLN